ncbi:U2 snRNP-associated SURP domain-containing protein [Geranomyces variabilis]|uniref:U2 snRNP-associated SURP domain-containing protein n=1 Tax=Geranomyces variabilis TaxID=109894 RepID=A0AAD5TDH7_9FUNG|nr:U2 snRNP-associated SURP domain-containing protein [Geranomyces variabilis]
MPTDDTPTANATSQKTKLVWDGEKSKPAVAKKIADTKLRAFTVGINKKTPFQKQQEEAAARKKKEEDEAALIYDDFVKSFDNDGHKAGTWVKAGTMMPKTVYDPESEPRERTLYKPQPFVKAGAPSFVKAGAPAFVKAGAPAFVKAEQAEVPSKTVDLDQEPAPSRPPPRKRNLDAFMQELKRDQEERDHRLKNKHARLAGGDSRSLTLRAAFEDNPGSHDTGDPDTTNLYLGNINPAVDEAMICQEFGRYGPIASVKIMWPRTPEEKERDRNCGFISFMTRRAAEEALRNLDGKDIMGNMLRVGWGKAVAIPAKPFYVHPKPLDVAPAEIARPITGGACGIGSHGSPREIKVVRPASQETTMYIHRLIERVLQLGPQFEAVIADRERSNPRFSFLFDTDSPEHFYYCWKLYSLLQGDSVTHWSSKPFHMTDDETVWIPPEVPFDDAVDENYQTESSSSSESEDSDTERRPPRRRTGTLARHQRARFEHMLRKLTLDRGRIGQAMIFCLDHAEAADEIVATIAKSLLIASTPVFPTKVARLYLLSDVLHNTATPLPNAWKLRAGIESRLDEIFTHLAVVRKGIGRRLRQEQLRRAVCEVLVAWEGWIVFPTASIAQLRSQFLEDPPGTADEQTSQHTPEPHPAGAESGENSGDPPARSKWSAAIPLNATPMDAVEAPSSQRIKFALAQEAGDSPAQWPEQQWPRASDVHNDAAEGRDFGDIFAE